MSLLLNSVMTATTNLRSHILQHRTEDNLSPMLQVLITRLHEEPDFGTKNLLTEVLRVLLVDDSNDVSVFFNYVNDFVKNTEELQEFLNIFYAQYALTFFKPLLETPGMDFG